MGVKGIGELKALQAQLKEAQSSLKQKMLAAAAQAALTQVQLGFRTSTAPDGTPWAALKLRTGKPLRDTGRLANSFTARATESGFVVGSNVDERIMVTHQEGRTIVPKRAKALRFPIPGARGRRSPSGFAFAKKVTVPARPMVPANGELPPKWREACEAAADRAVKNFFRKTK